MTAAFMPSAPMALDWFGASGLGDRLVAFIDSPHFAPIAIAVAFIAGAAHAVAPGHGKSLAAAYLVGSNGRIRDAVWLGASVAVMHTLSVLVIAVAWTFFSLSHLVPLQTLTGGMQLIAGLLIVALGVWLVRRHLLRAKHGHGHDHGHSHGHSHGPSHGHSHGPHHPHPHVEGHANQHDDSHATVTHVATSDQSHHEAHEHDHGQGHAHDHAAGHAGEHVRAPREDEPNRRRPGLILLGISGGLVPSPAAFLVLASGLYSGRAGFALLLVIVFGLGLASVLCAVGLLALWGRSFVVRAARSQAVLRVATQVAPVLSAFGITILGGVLAAMAATHLAAA